ncbi:apicoplast pyruvate carrier 1-like [Diadema antillarum]|uniref:apicoplast pyruvate carrier 1-like n=1 Tax=Diadema antillarum TaxID=105358 RepID=UPI003A858E48
MPSVGIWRGWVAVVGSILVHLTLGTMYSYGNMAPYVTSFIRKYSKPVTLSYQETSFIFGVMVFGQGISMSVGGFIESRLGPRFTTMIGCFLVSAGMMLSAVAIRVSFFLLLLTYGLIFGLGIGIAYVPPIVCCIRWLPHRKGLVSGLVVAGFGGGAFIFNIVQTAFLNPHNLKANITDPTEPTDRYYGQASILDKVPLSFILQGGIFLAIQLIGSLLITNPPQGWANGSFTDESSLLESEATPKPSSGAVESTGEGTSDKGSQGKLSPSKTLAFGTPKPVKVEEDTRVSGLDLTPKMMVKTKEFWLLWLTYLANGQGITLISTLYKAYGQTFINDDHFLAIVGSFSAVFNGLGRVFWGSLADKFSYRVIMMVLSGTTAALFTTLIATQYVGRVMFFIWVCAIFFVFSGNFALFPTVTARAFGVTSFGLNYGLVFTAMALSTLIGASLASVLHDHISWLGMFLIVAAFSFISVILTIFFRMTNREGNAI